MTYSRLREIREASGITQEQLAEMLGVPVLRVWKYENGKSKVGADYIAKVADALSVSADYLLGISDDPTPNELKNGLSVIERQILAALRRGGKYEAIKTIVMIPDIN